MNSRVTATGMQLTASTPTNILISNTATGAYSNSATADETFVSSGTPTVTHVLYPSSTAVAKVFNAIENSNTVKNGLGGTADQDTTFQITSGQAGSTVTALSSSADGYWATYTYWIKLGQAQESDAKVYLSSLSITDNTTAAAATKYVKAAGTTYDSITTATGVPAADVDNYVFANQDCTTKFLNVGEFNNATVYYIKPFIAKAARVAIYYNPTSGTETLLGIFAINGADDSVSAVTATITESGKKFNELGSTPTTNVSPKKADTNGDYTYTSGNTPEFAVDKDGTAIPLTVVVWIEGQDTHCINSNAGATFNIQLGFSVVPE